MKTAKLMIIGTLVILTVLGSGCSVKHTELGTSRHLPITVFVSEDMIGTVHSADDLGNRYDGQVSYSGIDNVMITIGGKNMDLDRAISNKSVTAENILSWAMEDSRSGLCTESFRSENGLNTFIYTYPEFYLEYTNDVYETPDGKMHIIRALRFCRPDIVHGDTAFLVDGGEPNEHLDAENWGIDIQVKDVNAQGILLSISQAGGQQFGDLIITEYSLYSALNDRWEYAPGENVSPCPLTMGGTMEYAIDWTTYYGDLPAGEYALKLRLSDQYDPQSVHPLCRNFFDQQSYIIHFTVE